MARPLVIVAAVARNGAIGRDNALPWTMPGDLARFKSLTMGCPMIMGRRTWQSIGRNLAGRESVVVSRGTLHLPEGAHAAGRSRACLDRGGEARRGDAGTRDRADRRRRAVRRAHAARRAAGDDLRRPAGPTPIRSSRRSIPMRGAKSDATDRRGTRTTTPGASSSNTGATPDPPILAGRLPPASRCQTARLALGRPGVGTSKVRKPRGGLRHSSW